MKFKDIMECIRFEMERFVHLRSDAEVIFKRLEDRYDTAIYVSKPDRVTDAIINEVENYYS